MKQEFIDFLNALMVASPDVVEEKMTDSVKAYIEALISDSDEKSALTENGKRLLGFLQEHSDTPTWKARDVADQLGISSRGISSVFRKLVSDGFCEKLGKDPVVIYALTDFGRNYKIED